MKRLESTRTRGPRVTEEKASAGGPEAVVPTWLLAVGLIGIAAIAWIPSLGAGFIWDDDTALLENPLMRSPSGPWRFWTSLAMPDFYPLTWTVMWLEWQAFGASALGHHAVNIVLHLLSALLVWRILLRLRVPGAWLAALVFAVHPVTVASVTWVSEIKNTLSLFFYALAVWGFLAADGDDGPVARGGYALSVGAFVAGLLSKTSGALLPAVLPFLVAWRRGRLERRDWLLSLPMGLASAGAVVLSMLSQGRLVGGGGVHPEGLASRLAASGWAFWFYQAKVAFPWRLSMVYPRWSVRPAEPLAWIPLLACIALVVACAWRRRSWGRPVGLAVGWSVAMLLPVAGFVDLYFMRYSLVADHWQYLSMIGTVALLVAAGTRAAESLPLPGRRVAGGMAGILVLVLMSMTWQQSRAYASREILWRETLAANPKAFVACYNLGVALKERGRSDEARDWFRKAVELEPGFALPYAHLGEHARATGDPAEAERWYRRGLEVDPGSADLRYNLGIALGRQGRHEEAVAQYDAALAARPGWADAYNNLGAECLLAGLYPRAVTAFRAARAQEPSNPAIRYNLGMALERQGDTAGAIAAYGEALGLDSRLVQAGDRQAWLLATAPEPGVRQPDRASAMALERCRATNRQDPGPLDVLAAAQAAQGRFDLAVATAREALSAARKQGSRERIDEITAHLGRYETMAPWISRPAPMPAGAR